jgi:hypothetical protein
MHFFTLRIEYEHTTHQGTMADDACYADYLDVLKKGGEVPFEQNKRVISAIYFHITPPQSALNTITRFFG